MSIYVILKKGGHFNNWTSVVVQKQEQMKTIEQSAIATLKEQIELTIANS